VAAASGPSIESDNQASETTVTQPAVTDAVRDSADESVADSDVVSDRHPFADALERLDQDEELLREQMQYFLQDGPGLLQTLADGDAVEQADGIRISAHRLKNLCATFDDDAAAALCQKTELAAVEGDADELQKLQPQVRRAVDRLQTKLRNYLRSA
jgi:HPt (histidine-containing phosphotransfer) domain-containing protein